MFLFYCCGTTKLSPTRQQRRTTVACRSCVWVDGYFRVTCRLLMSTIVPIIGGGFRFILHKFGGGGDINLAVHKTWCMLFWWFFSCGFFVLASPGGRCVVSCIGTGFVKSRRWDFDVHITILGSIFTKRCSKSHIVGRISASRGDRDL